VASSYRPPLRSAPRNPKTSGQSSFRTLESDSSFEDLWFWCVHACSNVFLRGDMMAHFHVDYSLLFPWVAVVVSEMCLLGVLLVAPEVVWGRFHGCAVPGLIICYQKGCRFIANGIYLLLGCTRPCYAERAYRPKMALPPPDVYIRLLLIRSPPKTGISTLQKGQQFNEVTFQTGVPPRPRYKFTRRLGGEICNRSERRSRLPRSQVSLQHVLGLDYVNAAVASEWPVGRVISPLRSSFRQTADTL
jgi:hypothetical protein